MFTHQKGEVMGERIAVLDYGYCELVEVWGSDESVVCAARMSTGKGFLGWGGNEVCSECGREKDDPTLPRFCTTNCDYHSWALSPAGDEKLLRYLYEHKHATPFEMAGMVIEVKAPIFVFREWHRHRTQSYNEMSARYIPLPDENYFPDIENLLNRAHTALDAANKQARTASAGPMLQREVAERDLADLFVYYEQGQFLYNRFLMHGWPKEIARLPVTVARYSRMRASANLRNWLAFLTLRCAPQAQWEIRQYANAVASLIAECFPRTYELFAKETKS